MAKQTLKSLLGSSDERKQVELNLNPVALQPTIRGAGNYRVAVQQTPKTNSLLQLSEALKGGVGLYGQAVTVAQDKAVKDVETMSEEDFDKFVAEGLDEESRNIFGYTKAYNFALAKKYYAEEMPMKLQDIAAELHKDPYKHKTPDEFEGAAIAAVNNAYDEADELLGGNVFGEQANNALKSATKADFLAKQQATYLERQPQITRQNASEGAFKAFSNITVATEAKKSIDDQMDIVAGLVGNRKDAAAIVTKAYLDNIEALAKQEGQGELAQQLLDELDSGEAEEKAGLQGRRGFGLDKVQLFNTAENRGRIEQLEDDIENAETSGYNAHIAKARRAQATIENKTFDMITGKEGSEAKGFEYLESLLEEMRTNKSITLNGVTYTDEIEIQEIRNFILGAQSNPKLFKHTAMSNFIATNGQAEAYAIGQLRNPDTLKTINKEAYDLLVDDELWQAGKPAFTSEGVTFNSAFTAKQEDLEQALFKSISHLPEGEKQAQFSALYPERVTAPMQEWTTDRLNSMVPEPTTAQIQAADAGLSPEEKTAFDAIAANPDFTPEEIQASQDDYLALKRAKEEAKVFITGEDGNFITGEDGNRELKTKGIVFKINPAIPYKKAIDNGYFKDAEEQARGLDVVFDSFNSMSGPNSPAKDSLIRGYNYPINFPNAPTMLQQSEKNVTVRESLSLNGVSLDDVANDSLRPTNVLGYNRIAGINKPVMLSGVYGKQGPFSSTPVLIDGSITNTISLVEGYFENKEAPLPPNIQKAADVYGMDVDTMMTQMQTYLTSNNFIKK